jgi:hypothetical protein
MYPHRIRLRGPWECESLRDPAGTRFRRRFGYPGQIDDYERVWLTFAGLSGDVVVILNTQPIGSFQFDGTIRTGTTYERDVTSLLLPRNELVIEVRPASEQPEVVMEVRRTAFLRRCRVWMEDKHWKASGELVGDAEGELELYLIVGRRTAAYRTLRASGGEVAFEMTADEEVEDAATARVELVQGAVVWYGVDVATGR